jgi:hypothetical protein
VAAMRSWLKLSNRRTFHFSMSSCFVLYCLTSSSSAFFRPSELVLRIGTTSLTVRSVKTPLIMRKHFRSPDSGSRVSNTSLYHVSMDPSVLRDEAVKMIVYDYVKKITHETHKKWSGVDVEGIGKSK